jgi:ribose/xylose/arabinose/galactoside ABC-type transport system permease subunit
MPWQLVVEMEIWALTLDLDEIQLVVDEVVEVGQATVSQVKVVVMVVIVVMVPLHVWVSRNRCRRQLMLVGVERTVMPMVERNILEWMVGIVLLLHDPRG